MRPLQARAQEGGRVDPQSPPAALAAVREAVAARGAVGGAFTESRTFPFKKTATILTGTTAFAPGKGLVLHYATPQERTILLVSKGLIEQDATGRHLRQLPAQYENMLALYDLNLAALAADFDIFFTSAGEAWTLRLEQNEKSVKAGKQRSVKIDRMTIVLKGRAGAVEVLEIVKPGAIAIAIQMENVAPLDATARAALEAQLKP
jgi:hypothetical protein